MIISDAASITDAIEELEDPNGHLAASAPILKNDVAKGGGACRPLLLVELADDIRQLRDGAGREVVIVGHGVQLTGTGEPLEQLAHAGLRRAYTMLTNLEAVFRSLKSELGLRPVFHHKTERVSGHLFISVLAYHLVHTIRFQPKACGIDLSWECLRRQLAGQDRVTIELRRAGGKTLHLRKSTRAEPRQQAIYDALGMSVY